MTATVTKGMSRSRRVSEQDQTLIQNLDGNGRIAYSAGSLRGIPVFFKHGRLKGRRAVGEFPYRMHLGASITNAPRSAGRSLCRRSADTDTIKTVKPIQKKYRHADHVSWRRVENDVVILDMNTSVYYSLNETGVVVWEVLGEGKSVDEAEKEVARRYVSEPRKVAGDVGKLIKSLLKENLLQPA
jgi:hypothetical protein